MIFIKLGGSLITDKQIESSFREPIVAQIAQDIAYALTQRPNLQLVVGHGSGSFGHFAARRHDTINGVHTREQWRGFVEVAHAAATLNHLVANVMQTASIPVWRIQPSASIICQDGVVQEMALSPISKALSHGIVPLVYGDVALDRVRGGTIASTEAIFTYLVQQLPVTQVLLLGEVDGVYDQSGAVIDEITPHNLSQYQDVIGGSAGTDVTGGMLTKVSDMVALAQAKAGLQVRIINGTTPAILREVLINPEQAQVGTLIHAG